MQILIYEYFTGGGLWSDGVRDPQQHPLLPEGRCMVRALSEDLARLAGVRLIQLQDARLRDAIEPLGRVVAVRSQQDELEQLADWSSRVDGVILIAPELEGRLLHRSEIVRRSEGRLLSPDSAFVRLTTNKCATAQHLAAHGVATPYAVRLPDPAAVAEAAKASAAPAAAVAEAAEASAAPHRRNEAAVAEAAKASAALPAAVTEASAASATLPERFPYPAVLKPIDGVGALETYWIQDHLAWPATAAADRVWRLEQFCPGTAVSVSALCGPRGAMLLPPCRQHIACDGRFSYLGGSYPLEPPLVRRACQLARRAFAALPATVGYVGIDMILADERSSLADVVVDVNPRLTTSYIGLRHATTANLADAMLAVARGESRPLFFQASRVQFDAEGCVTSGTLTAVASS